MNKIKKLMIALSLVLSLSTLATYAQDTMASDATSTSVTKTIDATDGGKDMSRYYWIGAAGLIVLVAGIGYAVRSKNKKNDDPHLSGDSINNPASGI